MNVSLTAALKNYVQDKVRNGDYESASEVIRDSLRALQERERSAVSYWATVREKVRVGRRQVAEGKTVDGESAMGEILAGLEAGAGVSRSRKARVVSPGKKPRR